ncbi:colanic acid/amylovoran biosynthesis glycosyltransferase [Cyclobacterium xiamenense]|uniref:Colanic acid/amylovoran biosynthesis glycosyltransferase n=1 Tax=Cyclobacterium xiamenense TaxID=1297121 RepID=A0A1H6ZZK6_9BACT|nr:glycosyltransferase [Cyclobacterium xiamenense]SEJ58873.1 colanic acid/amylovoran biosynthesis glycosyltransferase [Cyclobacterium xiamenense]
MRIAFIVEAFPKLSETFILNQVTALLNLGHDVEIFPSRNIDEVKTHPKVGKYGLLKKTFYPPIVPDLPILQKLKCAWLVVKNFSNIEIINRILSLPYPIDSKISLFFRILPLIGKEKFDIIHCHFGPLGNVAVQARSLGILSGKMVLSFYGYDATRYNLDVRYYAGIVQQFDAFIVISNYLKGKIIKLGFPEERIKTIPLGVDVSDYNILKVKNKKTGHKLLTVARLVEKKGVYYGIMAFSQLKNKNKELEYHIVGDGLLSDRLKELIEELGLGECVFLHGAKNKEEIFQFYRDADVFVLPSITASDGNTEGQGLVLQEAQLMELPIVSTFHNGIPEGVVEDETGFLVPERDIDALSEKIGTLLANEQLRTEMGKKGRDLVLERFDNRKLVEELSEYYKFILTPLEG